MTESVEAIVVGAGVVGLAIGRALAGAGCETLILEAAEHFGSEISSRSSEVIHAGIYYPAGSLKARLCIEGRDRLYAYCRERGVEHRRLGKLIVASHAAQVPALRELRAKAAANGVDDLAWLDAAAVHALEPDLRAEAALLSPSTGIVDSHALMLSYLADAEAAGAVLAVKAPFLGGQVSNEGFGVQVGGGETLAVSCRYLVDAAGLGAQAVAGALSGLDPAQVPPRHLAKGSYFVLGPRAPFRHLIYPMPEAAGLGVHLTLDLAGRARFGPDVEWIESIDYRVDPRRGDSFYEAIRRYWPDLPDGALQPGYAGIRPKLQGPGGPAEDFMVQGPRRHGIPGLVNLFGIESPGLTASLAIARLVLTELGLEAPDP
jgi:L-2-hydroxyglutarate oxidase LhgO